MASLRLHCAGLLVALAPAVAVAAQAGAPTEPVTPGSPERGDAVAARQLVEAVHERLVFDEDVTKVAVGREETLSFEILSSREILVLGRTPGRTSLIVWFASGRTETVIFSIEPDFSLLRSALRDIHPSISAEFAADQAAVVLRGIVPNLTFRTAAESAAAAYLQSRGRGRGRSGGGSTPLSTAAEEPAEGEEAGDGVPSEVRTDGLPDRGAVINLIRLETLPSLADEKIRAALAPLEGGALTVRRVMLGDVPDDALDVFVLEGTVPDQVTLTRALYLASRALLGGEARQNDIRVLADEAGGLADVRNLFGASLPGGGGANQGGQSLINTPGQQRGGRGNQQLVNRIGANIGRAKVIEAAGGRILAMITVEHLPLVRVDVRLYEVNLTRLRQWQSDIGVITSDFDQGDFNPAVVAEALQDTGATRVGQDDIQNVFGFLGGEFGSQTQLVSGGLAVDSLFSLLVNEQVARALSRPSLTVLSGELALFQVGGQVPVPVALTVGGGTDQVLSGVEFRNFGVELSVRPLVEEIDAETITLDLSPIVSLPDLDLTSAIATATGTNPGTTAFETRGTRTHTRLRDGDAMLLGGLITQREEKAQANTPGLGDVPLLGWLFRNEAENAEDFELVIVVNPVIVRPERPDARLWSFIEPASLLSSCLEAVRGARDERVAEEADREQRTQEARYEILGENPRNAEPHGNERHLVPEG